MLATEVVSAQRGDAAKRHPCSIEQVPGLTLMLDSHVHTLHLLQRLHRLQSHTFVDNLVRYVIYPIGSAVWIKWELRKLRLNLYWLLLERVSLFHLFFHVY